MNETVLKAIHSRHKPGDKYMINTIYTYSSNKELKSYGSDYTRALIDFNRIVSEFDIYYKGSIILFKNKVENEIIRVNL